MIPLILFGLGVWGLSEVGKARREEEMAEAVAAARASVLTTREPVWTRAVDLEEAEVMAELIVNDWKKTHTQRRPTIEEAQDLVLRGIKEASLITKGQ